jgi:hypothetical protein
MARSTRVYLGARARCRKVPITLCRCVEAIQLDFLARLLLFFWGELANYVVV